MIGVDIKLATASLRSAKVRTFLTMVAIIIGVAGYVMVTSFVDGLKTSVTAQIQEFGGNLITINSGDLTITDEEGNVIGFNPLAGFGGAPTLTERDLEGIRNLENIKGAAPQMLISLSGSVKRNDNSHDGVMILATNEDYPPALGQNVEIGKFFEDDDSDLNVVVLGKALVEEMFPAGTGIGTLVEIRKETFRVIGVMEEVPSGGVSFGTDLNRLAIIPLEIGKEFNGGTANIMEIDVQVAEGGDADSVVAAINELLLENHGGEKDFTVLKEDELVELTSTVLDQIKSASQVLAYVMMFVGGVVIALIMLITVKERTREIGIRKSIGATNGNIRMQFLVEAVVISWLGSVLGVLLAYLIGLYVAGISDLTPSYTMNTLVSVIVISTLIGATSGIIPAAIAAKKDPVEALRDE